MGLDVAATETRAAEPSPVVADRGSLTRKASLNVAASLLDFGSKAGANLLITPLLVSGLGRSLYGMWEILSRLGSYLSVTDGRPTEALRLVIAQRQNPAEGAENRRYVGAALAGWLLMLPLVLVAGGVFVWWVAPRATHASPATIGAIRNTSWWLLGAFIVTSLGSVPESALRGMNLGYRRMGLQAGLNLLGAGLAAAAVFAGLGLVGLGAANGIRSVAAAVCFWALARSYVSWFGVDRPARRHVRRILTVSLWIAGGDIVAKALLASDVVILGAVASASAVAGYSLTGYAARTALAVHLFAAGAAMPGVGGLLGSGELARAARVRQELLLLTWFFVTTAGAVMLASNRSFVGLWVGSSYYTGWAVDVLIAVGFAQTGLLRTDAYLIDAALRPAARVRIGALAAVLTVALSITLTRAYGVIGLCVGLIAGRMVQSIGYPWLIRQSLRSGENGAAEPGLPVARLGLVTGATFLTAAIVGQRIVASTWIAWVGLVALTGVAAGSIAFFSLNPEHRRAIVTRLATVRRAVSR